MNLAPVFKQRFFDGNGAPLAGGLLYSYAAGTTTPQTTYSNATGTANTNPVVLDSQGYADVWLDPTLAYKFVLKDSGGVQQWSEDNVQLPMAGIAWASTQVYSAGDLVKDSSGQGLLYVSRTNSNVGNALTNVSAWRIFGGNIQTYSSDTTLSVTDELVRSNSTSGNRTHTLPPCSTTPIGKKITIKDVGSGGNTTSVKGSGTDNIDGSNTFSTALRQYVATTFVNNGSSWDALPNGSLAIATSSSSGPFSTTSGTFVDVTNLSVTITTGGRPVLIALQSDGNGATHAQFVGAQASSATGTGLNLALFRGATQLTSTVLEADGASATAFVTKVPPGAALHYIDQVAAGTYTYKVQVSAGSSNTALVQYCKLVAFEL